MENIEELNFIHEIKERLKMPWRPFNWAFWGYFIGIIIGLGGLGIWLSIYDALQTEKFNGTIIAVSIATYFIALLASSFIDLNLLPSTKNKISMLVYSVIFLGLGVLLFYLSNNIKTNKVFIPALIGFFFSLLVWYIAYADSDKFNEDSYNEKIMKEGAKKHGAQWSNS